MIFPWYFPNVYFLTAIRLLLTGTAHTQGLIKNTVKRLGWNLLWKKLIALTTAAKCPMPDVRRGSEYVPNILFNILCIIYIVILRQGTQEWTK